MRHARSGNCEGVLSVGFGWDQQFFLATRTFAFQQSPMTEEQLCNQCVYNSLKISSYSLSTLNGLMRDSYTTARKTGMRIFVSFFLPLEFDTSRVQSNRCVFTTCRVREAAEGLLHLSYFFARLFGQKGPDGFEFSIIYSSCVTQIHRTAFSIYGADDISWDLSKIQ